jgi:hypothetical protein
VNNPNVMRKKQKKWRLSSCPSVHSYLITYPACERPRLPGNGALLANTELELRVYSISSAEQS